MTDSREPAGSGLLLPFESLALLGAGPQGAAAICNYGVGSDGFEGGFMQLIGRLDAADDAESTAEREVSLLVAAAARRAHGWISIRSDGSLVPPAIVILSEGATLVAVLHGPVVEYALGDDDLVSRVIRGALESDPTARLRVTLCDRDEVIVDAYFAQGDVRLAAKDADRFERCVQAAGEGFDRLAQALVSESAGRQPPVPVNA
ncbi:hypothetical protein [Microbacterium capsulatum]|uniref:Uncharacterized protein n=1 Tax=Microbacterium capsulatum TaxID=3041921 RepID=A0ABU0XEA6_9MICO|nr:hypothetical protein [Microbacterium sp. ASV81]MDQ4213451.1 hypothetical protein [Microbacterium sp. ASV81]